MHWYGSIGGRDFSPETTHLMPVNGNFNDCMSEILKELGAEEIDYEDDEDIE